MQDEEIVGGGETAWVRTVGDSPVAYLQVLEDSLHGIVGVPGRMAHHHLVTYCFEQHTAVSSERLLQVLLQFLVLLVLLCRLHEPGPALGLALVGERDDIGVGPVVIDDHENGPGEGELSPGLGLVVVAPQNALLLSIQFAHSLHTVLPTRLVLVFLHHVSELVLYFVHEFVTLLEFGVVVPGPVVLWHVVGVVGQVATPEVSDLVVGEETFQVAGRQEPDPVITGGLYLHVEVVPPGLHDLVFELGPSTVALFSFGQVQSALLYDHRGLVHRLLH